jgi:hypothetical protein
VGMVRSESGICPRALEVLWIGRRVEFPLGAGSGGGGAGNRGGWGQCWRQGGLESANELPGRLVVNHSKKAGAPGEGGGAASTSRFLRSWSRVNLL